MKYSLRSLMIAVLVLPPLLAGGWLVTKSLWRQASFADEPLFDPDGLPEPMVTEWSQSPASSAPAPNPPKP
jgi:hypothetical protein